MKKTAKKEFLFHITPVLFYNRRVDVAGLEEFLRARLPKRNTYKLTLLYQDVHAEDYAKIIAKVRTNMEADKHDWNFEIRTVTRAQTEERLKKMGFDKGQVKTETIDAALRDLR